MGYDLNLYGTATRLVEICRHIHLNTTFITISDPAGIWIQIVKS